MVRVYGAWHDPRAFGHGGQCFRRRAARHGRSLDEVEAHDLGQGGQESTGDLARGAHVTVHQQMQNGFPGPGIGGPHLPLPAPGLFQLPAQTEARCGIREKKRQIGGCRAGYHGGE